jgi:serpin B
MKRILVIVGLALIAVGTLLLLWWICIYRSTTEGARPPMQRPPEPQVSSEVADSAVAANNLFAVDLYKRMVYERYDENLFFSPLSISNGLAMVAEGAEGDTREEIRRVLHLSDDMPMEAFHQEMLDISQPFDDSFETTEQQAERERLDAHWKEYIDVDNRRNLLVYGDPGSSSLTEEELIAEIQKLGEQKGELSRAIHELSNSLDPNEFRLANSLWGEETYPFSSGYVETIEQLYAPDGVFTSDFINAPDHERSRMNAWANEKTRGKISEAMPSGSVTPETRLVLINSIYFKGGWQDVFHEEYTEPRDFHFSDGRTTVQRETMYSEIETCRYAAFHADGSFYDTPHEAEFRDRDMNEYGGPKAGAEPLTECYPENDGFQVIEMAYKGEYFSMVILAPLDPTGLLDLESKLTAENLDRWIGHLDSREVYVYLPKFKFEANYELSGKDTQGVLQKLGVNLAFQDPANSSPGADLSPMHDSQLPGLFLTGASHCTSIDVHEKGTEAAAVASFPYLGFGAAFSPQFRADRPFFFLIRDRQSGTILFMGRVLDPQY